MYYPNGWAKGYGLPSLGELSALEYVWRIGDANFIELFKEYFPSLPAKSFDRIEAMAAEWIDQCDALVQGLKAYSDGGSWPDFNQTYSNAPLWVYGLEYFILAQNITTEKIANVDLISPEFRAAARLRSATKPFCLGHGEAPRTLPDAVWRSVTMCVATYLSRSHTPKQQPGQ